MTTVSALCKLHLPLLLPEDFFILLAHATGQEKVFLLAHPEYVVKIAPRRRFEQYAVRRIQHEPIAYITGHKEFYGFDFHVTSDTLIPRPETEILVEHAGILITNQLSTDTHQKIICADIGTGSGNIIIALAKSLASTAVTLERVAFYASDLSTRALRVAKKNARRLTPLPPIVFRHGSLIAPHVSLFSQADILILLANLPYVSETLYAKTAADIRYEPVSALMSGENGLSHYLLCCQELRAHREKLPQEIIIIFEISPEQAPSLTAYIEHTFPGALVSVIIDLAQKKRFIMAIIKK